MWLNQWENVCIAAAGPRLQTRPEEREAIPGRRAKRQLVGDERDYSCTEKPTSRSCSKCTSLPRATVALAQRWGQWASVLPSPTPSLPSVEMSFYQAESMSFRLPPLHPVHPVGPPNLWGVCTPGLTATARRRTSRGQVADRLKDRDIITTKPKEKSPSMKGTLRTDRISSAYITSRKLDYFA